MLETIREYAGERLEKAGELGVLRQRHARWVLEWTSSARRRDRSPSRLRLGDAKCSRGAGRAANEQQVCGAARACHQCGAGRSFQLGAARESKGWLDDALHASHACPPGSCVRKRLRRPRTRRLFGDAEVGTRIARPQPWFRNTAGQSSEDSYSLPRASRRCLGELETASV